MARTNIATIGMRAGAGNTVLLDDGHFVARVRQIMGAGDGDDSATNDENRFLIGMDCQWIHLRDPVQKRIAGLENQLRIGINISLSDNARDYPACLINPV